MDKTQDIKWRWLNINKIMFKSLFKRELYISKHGKYNEFHEYRIR
jgi:hypothetical protein